VNEVEPKIWLISKLETLGNRRTTWLIALIVLSVVWLWITPLGASLWLDETGTYWVIQEGLSGIPSRAAAMPQFSLYFFIAGLAVALGGASEALLRLPSVIAMALAAFLLYRLGKRLLDQEAALLATLVFVGWKEVAFAAADARPYAVGLLLVIASMLLLIRWLETGRLAEGLGYILLASLTVYTHYLFAAMFLVHAIYAIQRLRARPPARLMAVCGAGILSAALLLPVLPRVLFLARSGAKYSFVGKPWLPQLLEFFSPPVLVSSVLIGLLLARFVRPAYCFSKPPTTRAPLLLLVSWAAAPPLLLWAVSILTPARVFVGRYTLCAVPGLALLAGWALRAIAPAHKRLLVASSLALGSLICFAPFRGGSFVHGNENWRQAMQTVRSIAGTTRTPVLLRTGLVEALLPDSPSQPLGLDYSVSAPLSMYPAGGRVISLPYWFDLKAQEYLDRLAAEILQPADRFLFVSRAETGAFPAWLKGRFAGQFTSKPLGNFGLISVILFERRPGAPGAP
jgi:hypothetical protein